MNLPTILVTGATGKTGTAVVMQLRAQDRAVGAVVRTREERSEQQYGSQVGQRDRRNPVFGDEGLEGGRDGTGGLLVVAELDGAPIRSGNPPVGAAPTPESALNR